MAEKDFIERTADHWRNRGLEWSPENAVQNFRLYGPSKRSEALDQFDSELAAVEPTVGNIRKYLEMTELRQAMDDEHHMLLKVNR
jgi:hypothetical protein